MFITQKRRYHSNEFTTIVSEIIQNAKHTNIYGTYATFKSFNYDCLSNILMINSYFPEMIHPK